MRRSTRLAVLIATAAASLAFCADGQAAIITLGSSLEQTYTPAAFTTPSTVINAFLPHSPVRSPVNGVIVRWRLEGSFGQFDLRVLTPDGGSTYTGAGTSGPQTAIGTGLETFPADLPIRTGQTIGLDTPGSSDLGVAVTSGEAGFWQPPLADGATGAAAVEVNRELAFNADVQPAPTITSVSPASGVLDGGTAVTISGTDFEGAGAVSFGGTPTSSFTVDSESQIAAVAPAAAAGPVDVSVTTIAGTATLTQQFTYARPALPTPPAPASTCTVPKLKGKKLKAAKNALTKAHCKIGKTTEKNDANAKSAKVVEQKPRPGAVLAPGSKVSVKLSDATAR
jgi:hypothetical protein